MSGVPDVSVVVPVYNEAADNLKELANRVARVLDGERLAFELIFVDDGSGDECKKAIDEIVRDGKNVQVVVLSRNFGEQAAISAGLSHSQGMVVVNMDSDLQDPPELIPQMIATWKAGSDIVFTRQIKRHDGPLRSWLATGFYRLLDRVSERHIVLDSGEFRLMSRRAVNVLLTVPELNRFLRVMVPWLGFKHAVIDFERRGRAAGLSGYNYTQLFKLALFALLTSTTAPLRYMWVWAILLFVAAPLMYFVPASAIDTRGIVFALLIVGGILMGGIAIIAAYLGLMYVELRRRPLYLVAEIKKGDLEHSSDSLRAADFRVSSIQ